MFVASTHARGPRGKGRRVDVPRFLSFGQRHAMGELHDQSGWKVFKGSEKYTLPP